MRNTEEALKWIVNILDKHKIPFQIAGGFASRLYGSKRELADIDINIPENRIQEIIGDVKDYITFGPEMSKDENWDLFMMTLKYQEQEIDICVAESIKILNQNTKQFEKLVTDFSGSILKEIYGIKVPIIPIEELIIYKNKLSREVDLSDVREISI